MSALLEMLKMDEGEFSSFFRSQMQLGNRFSGPLFSILREAYGNSNSEVLRGNILQFLKRYSDYSSSAVLGPALIPGYVQGQQGD